jgi:surface polysaccharide O-acyltransferase-like enzyme
MQETKALKQRNNSIDCFRYFCALLVVVIHAHPLAYFSKELNSISIDYFTRIAVPFFFMVSGYYFTKKIIANKANLKAYLLSILGIYAFWSVVYAVKANLSNIKKHHIDMKIVKNVLLGFLYKGTSEHLWYIPSLMLAIIVLYVFYRLKIRKVLYAYSILVFTVACLGFSYNTSIGSKIPLLNSLYASPNFTYVHRLLIFGICFATLGSFICEYEKRFLEKSSKHYFIMIAAMYALFVIEKVAVKLIPLGTNNLYNFALAPLMFVIFMFLLKNPLPGFETAAKYLRNASSFVYFSHPLFMWIFRHYVKSELIIYLLVCISTTAISFAITKIDNKYLNFFNR